MALSYGYQARPPGAAPLNSLDLGVGYQANPGQIAGRGGISLPQQQPQRQLANLIGQQPLPVNTSQQYAQLLAMYNQQAQQLTGYGSQVSGLQNQLTRMYSADPTGMANRQLMALYGSNPFAAEHAQIMAQMSPPQRINQGAMLYGY